MKISSIALMFATAVASIACTPAPEFAGQPVTVQCNDGKPTSGGNADGYANAKVSETDAAIIVTTKNGDVHNYAKAFCKINK